MPRARRRLSFRLNRRQLFRYPISFMWIMPASFAVSLGVSYVLGRILPPPDAARLAFLYHGPVASADDASVP